MDTAWIKKYPVFALGLLAAVALLVLASGVLFMAYRQYDRQLADLNQRKARQDSLLRRVPFPSDENIRRERERLQDLVDHYNELNELLRSDQVEPGAMEAADFLQFLEKTLRQMRSRLQAARIKFPDKYVFGFERYAGGQLPAPADIPRLVQQLKIVERLCEDLMAAGIVELVGIEREPFESASGPGPEAAPGGRGRREAASGPGPEAAPGPDAAGRLFTVERVKLTFKARESGVIDLLNRLTGHPMFMRIAGLLLRNPRQDCSLAGAPAAPARPAAATGAPAAESAADAERPVILGREELEGVLDLEVFRFAPSLSVTEAVVP